MVRKEYSEWTQIVQWFSFKFVHESETLTLNISENGDVSGHWKVQAIVSPPKVLCCLSMHCVWTQMLLIIRSVRVKLTIIIRFHVS